MQPVYKKTATYDIHNVYFTYVGSVLLMRPQKCLNYWSWGLTVKLVDKIYTGRAQKLQLENLASLPSRTCFKFFILLLCKYTIHWDCYKKDIFLTKWSRKNNFLLIMKALHLIKMSIKLIKLIKPNVLKDNIKESLKSCFIVLFEQIAKFRSFVHQILKKSIKKLFLLAS